MKYHRPGHAELFTFADPRTSLACGKLPQAEPSAEKLTGNRSLLPAPPCGCYTAGHQRRDGLVTVQHGFSHNRPERIAAEGAVRKPYLR
jgi:hypothetical protein